jgi:hypothetical protein
VRPHKNNAHVPGFRAGNRAGDKAEIGPSQIGLFALRILGGWR